MLIIQQYYHLVVEGEICWLWSTAMDAAHFLMLTFLIFNQYPNAGVIIFPNNLRLGPKMPQFDTASPMRSLSPGAISHCKLFIMLGWKQDLLPTCFHDFAWLLKVKSQMLGFGNCYKAVMSEKKRRKKRPVCALPQAWWSFTALHFQAVVCTLHSSTY